MKRLAASVTVLGRENGLKTAACRQAVCAMSQAYRTRMRELSDKPYLDIWFTPTRAEAAVDASGMIPLFSRKHPRRWVESHQPCDAAEAHR